jgi:hypothetical protein
MFPRSAQDNVGWGNREEAYGYGVAEDDEEQRKAERNAGIVLALGVVAAVVANGLGVSGLPSWAFLLASSGVVLTTSVVTFGVTCRPKHRVPALWAAIAVLAVTLVGSWTYDAVAEGTSLPAAFVADRFVPFSLEPGGPPSTGAQGDGLTPGAVNTAKCYVSWRGRVWLNFGDDEWLPRPDVHVAPGYPGRLPPLCG